MNKRKFDSSVLKEDADQLREPVEWYLQNGIVEYSTREYVQDFLGLAGKTALSVPQIAKEYGVSRAAVSKVVIKTISYALEEHDAFMQTGDILISKNIAREGDPLIVSATKDELEHFISHTDKLNDLEKSIAILHFGLFDNVPHSQKQIELETGLECNENLTTSAIKRKLFRALNKHREQENKKAEKEKLLLSKIDHERIQTDKAKYDKKELRKNAVIWYLGKYNENERIEEYVLEYFGLMDRKRLTYEQLAEKYNTSISRMYKRITAVIARAIELYELKEVALNEGAAVIKNG